MVASNKPMKKLLPILLILFGYTVSGQKSSSFSEKINVQSNSNELVWDEIESSINGFSRVLKGTKFSYVNAAGTLISPVKFDGARNFSNQMAAVQINEKWGFINEKGTLTIPCVYDLVYDFTESNTVVFQNSKWCLIDKSGRKIKLIDAEVCYGIKNGIILVQKNNRKAHLEADGNFVYDEPIKENNLSQQRSITPITNNANTNCPNNLGFEYGNFTNWKCFTGTVDSIGTTNIITVSPVAGPVNNRHRIISRAMPSPVDFYGLFSTNPPDGSTFAVKLGNTNIGAQAERISYKIRVPLNDSNFSIKYDYAVVFQDPDHTPWSQPRFTARLFDSAANRYVDCASFEYIATSNLPGFTRSTVDTSVMYKAWSTVFVSMRAFAGKTMFLEFTTADCVRRGHWGYAYVDVENTCGQSIAFQYDCNYPNTTTLDAPPGFQYYNWWNQTFSTVLATGQHAVLNPGPRANSVLYLEMIPYNTFGCRDTISVTVTGGFTPAFHSSETNISCAPRTVTFYNHSLPSLVTTWNFGDGTTATGDTVNHTFTAAGTYTITMNVVLPSGCVGSTTNTIVVNPNVAPPTVACYQTATFNPNTCRWDVTGTQPVQPVLACYQSATFNTTTCSWDVRGTQPVQPALACYQTATFNTSTCRWDVTGTQPVQPALACYQTATFNTTTCSWDVTGTQPVQPALACYQSVTFNSTTCSWDVSGTQTQTNITGPTTICAGEQATFNAVVYSSTNVVAINWNCNNGNTASGNSFTVSFPQSGTFNVTMIATTSNGCVDTAVKQIIVKSLPTFTQPSDQNICSGTATLPVRFVSAINNTTFTWTNDNTSVGLVASGTGNIASFIALNNTSTTEYANIIVTATSQGCSYTAPAFTYIVNPIPVAIQPSNQTICNRAMTDPIFFNTFTSAVASNDYTWTNNQSSIGLAASGSGNIYAFMAQNNTNSPVTATITIVPTANGCVGAPANFTITVNPSPDVAQPIDQQVCNGQQIQAVAFNGTVAGTTFNWTNNNPSIGLAAYGNNTIQPFTAINNSNVRTTATITVTTIANGCTGNARTFEISVEPTPNLAQPTNIVACNGAIINPSDFIASVSGTSFNWLNSDSEIGIPANGVGDIPTFTATNSHNYPITATIVVVATANGCNNAQRTFTITINPSITIDSIPDQMICNGSRMNSINFTAPVSGTAISWSNDNTSIGLGANGSGSLAAFTAINNSAQNLIAHIIVSGSNVNNCQASNRTFTIIVAPSPLISAGNDINICRGTQANLTASGAVQFNWMPSASLSCLQCANPVTTATSNETYIVEGTNAMGCKSYDSVSVTVIQPFQMFVSPNDSLCAGKSIRLKAMNADQYSWSPAIGLNYTNIAEPIATPTSNITYQVIGYDAHHCFSDTGYVNITVNQTPSVNAGADIEAAAGTTVTLHGNAQNGPITNWTWSPATNLSCADCPTPVLTVSNNTTYVVTVENTYGCKASDSVNIVTFCKNAQVFIPNAFTPDGDGSNDILMVRGTGISVKSFRIFNRWGNLVFEKQSFQPNDPKYGWDGKVKGVLATPDVYVYIAEVACDNGTPYLYKGNVTVLQ